MGLVMQEPTLFNYSIRENILYGDQEAMNSEIMQASEISNASEFIESQEITNTFDDSADTLLKEWKVKAAEIKMLLSEKEYAEISEKLELLSQDEVKKGKFISVDGTID